jgi:hypothetical protein
MGYSQLTCCPRSNDRKHSPDSLRERKQVNQAKLARMTDGVLRDMAYVYHLTQSVKEAMLLERLTPAAAIN